MIRLRDLTVELGGVRALDRLTADLDAPVHGVIGPNGAGKTTLLNVMSGFVAAASGSIEIDGFAIGSLPARRRSRWGLGRTFQTERLAPQLSGYDNIAVAAEGIVSGRGNRRGAIEEAIEIAGIPDPEVRVASLDGFQRKLVEIARALAGRPRVLLLDEPGGGLSVGERARLEETLERIQTRTEVQIILVDHDVDLIARICSKVIVLDFGSLLAGGDTAEVLADQKVKAAWLGTAEVAA